LSDYRSIEEINDGESFVACDLGGFCLLFLKLLYEVVTGIIHLVEQSVVNAALINIMNG